MQTILEIKKLYELKHVLRDNHVRNRIESVAEHSWSSLILADYFLSTLPLDIDRLRVYELLMYHDVVEIETGDIPVGDLEARKNKKEKELPAMKKLKEDIPAILRDKFERIFHEFEEKKTLEARFAHAIDKLDADLHAMEHPVDEFGVYTEELIRNAHQKYFLEFPEINDMFEKLIVYYKEIGAI